MKLPSGRFCTVWVNEAGVTCAVVYPGVTSDEADSILTEWGTVNQQKVPAVVWTHPIWTDYGFTSSEE